MWVWSLCIIYTMLYNYINSGFATLSDYQSSSSMKKDEDEGEKFFAGGSEHR